MSENTIESVKEGLARYTKTRTAEESMNNAAVQTFADAMVEQGRLTEAQVGEAMEMAMAQPKFSLAADVVSILEEYDTEGLKYGSMRDVADAIEGLIAESTEDATELENILDNFRAAQDDARRWGNRMDSGGEEEFEEALRAYVNKATLGERSDVDSSNSSSEGLLFHPSGRLRNSAYGGEIDGAKLREIDKKTKGILQKIRAYFNGEWDVKNAKNVNEAVRVADKLGLRKSSNSNSYYGEYFEGDYGINGEIVGVRVSTHPANPLEITKERDGVDPDHKVSVVIRKNGKHKSDGTPHSGYTEYVYEPSEVTPPDAADAVVKGLKSLFETGEFVDETGKAVRRDYPYTDNRGRTIHSLITPKMDASYLDAVERGDMATEQRMVMEAAKLAMANTKVVDENGDPKVVYHQTNATVYINRETEQNWDELDWRERMEWDERDDWDDYWEEREFNTFSRVNARTTQELDGFFFAPEYDEYHEYGDRTISAFLNITNPASFGDYNIDSSKTNAGRDERIRLQNEGYDGVINEEDGSIWEYVAFNPNQIKSADPVTYDDAGNVIPLSERLNPEKEDIRYSVNDFDSKVGYITYEANTLGVEQTIIVAETLNEYLEVLKDLGVKDIERYKKSAGIYDEEADVIVMRSDIIQYEQQAFETLMHEYAHAHTNNLKGEIENVLHRLDETVISSYRDEKLPEIYRKISTNGILNEIISYFVEEIPRHKIYDFFNGYLDKDDIFLVDWQIEEKAGEKYAPIFKALMPIIGKNLEQQKISIMENREKHSSLPEDIIQRMEQKMKDPKRVLMTIRAEDKDPKLANPELIEMLSKFKAERLKKK